MKKLNNFELPSGEVTFSAEYIKESELNSSDTMAHKNIDQVILFYVLFLSRLFIFIMKSTLIDFRLHNIRKRNDK